MELLETIRVLKYNLQLKNHLIQLSPYIVGIALITIISLVMLRILAKKNKNLFFSAAALSLTNPVVIYINKGYRAYKKLFPFFRAVGLFLSKNYKAFNNRPFFSKTNLLIITVIIFTPIFILYFPGFSGYFQQDEWYWSSTFIPYTHGPLLLNGIEALLIPFKDVNALGFHFTPLEGLLYWAQYRFFHFNYIYFYIFSIALHTINSLLVTIFSYKITKNSIISIIAGLFFSSAASHSGAVTWMAGAINTQGALFFALLSMIFIYDHLQIRNARKYFLGILFFLASVLTKETSVFLILIVPLFASVTSGLKGLKKIKLFYLAVLVFLGIRLLIPRIIALATHIPATNGINEKNLDLFFSFYYFITLLLKAIAQTFFSGIDFQSIVPLVTEVGYPQYNTEKAVGGFNYLTFTQSAGLDLVLYFFAFITVAILAVFLTSLYYKKGSYFKAAAIGVLIVVFSILPFTLLSGWYLSFFTYLSALDSRHLYITTVGASIIIGILVYVARNMLVQYKVKPLIASLVLIALIIGWFVLQNNALVPEYTKQNLSAKERKEIIAIWSKDRPRLEKRNIFYSESNVALYGFAEYMLPFQMNMAYILTSLYGYDQVLPSGFYTKAFFNKKLFENWYEVHDGIGLGYYLDKKTLTQAVVKYNLNVSDIVGVRYNGHDHTSTSITKEIREELQKYLDKRNALIKKGWKYYEDKKINYFFLYPPEYTITHPKINDKRVLTTVQLVNARTNASLFSIITYKNDLHNNSMFAATLEDGNGVLIGENYTIRSLKTGIINDYTAVYIDNPTNIDYFFNTKTNDELKQIIVPSVDSQTEVQKLEISNILSFLEFNN